MTLGAGKAQVVLGALGDDVWKLMCAALYFQFSLLTFFPAWDFFCYVEITNELTVSFTAQQSITRNVDFLF